MPDLKISIRRVAGAPVARVITYTPFESTGRSDHWAPDPGQDQFEEFPEIAAAACACIRCSLAPNRHKNGLCVDGETPQYLFEQAPDSKAKLTGSNDTSSAPQGEQEPDKEEK
jgi:hypothetical protein